MIITGIDPAWAKDVVMCTVDTDAKTARIKKMGKGSDLFYTFYFSKQSDRIIVEHPHKESLTTCVKISMVCGVLASELFPFSNSSSVHLCGPSTWMSMCGVRSNWKKDQRYRWLKKRAEMLLEGWDHNVDLDKEDQLAAYSIASAFTMCDALFNAMQDKFIVVK